MKKPAWIKLFVQLITESSSFKKLAGNVITVYNLYNEGIGKWVSYDISELVVKLLFLESICFYHD